MKFSELNLSKEVNRAIADCEYHEATYIQSACIPVLLSGGNVIGQSQTGTGKTAAFGIPIIEMITSDGDKRPKALILSPTRELALQVTEEIRKFAKYKEGIRTVCIYGGTPITNQIQDLKKGCDIVVGTPGRILDHINRHTLKLANCSKIVLDEADEMLNMGFREDIETIMRHLPEERQTVLFSATMPKSILDITSTYVSNAIHIKTPAQEMTASKIKQVVYECKQSDKRDVLMQLIELDRPELAMVFCNTKKMVDDLTSELVSKGYPAAAIHGDMKQEARSHVMERFKKRKLSILICTDVAARGIDVSDMDAVYNFDFPQETEYYVHRIGRTARAGKEGLAVTLLTPRQRFLINDLQKITRAKIETRPLPSGKMIEEIRLRQTKEDLQKMLNEPISKRVDSLLENLLQEGFTEMELLRALANHCFASRLLEVIEAPKKESNSLNATSKDKIMIEINVGKKHEVTPAHIVSAIAEATGINGKDIGKIAISDRTSTIEIPKEFEKEIVNDLKNTTVRGFEITVSVKKGSKSRDQKSFGGKPRSDSSRSRTPRNDSKPRSDSRSRSRTRTPKD